MVDVAPAFIIAGTLLSIGFLADLIFERTGIPDLLVMMFLGVLVGPVLGVVDPNALSGIAPFFASLAIAVILFDGGLNLRLHQVLRESPRALVLALLGFSVTVLVTAIFAIVFLGWSIAEGALLGAVLGGSSSAVVMPLIARTNASPRVVTLLSLESVFTDALVVVIAISVLQFIMRPAEVLQVTSFAREIAGAFLIGAIVGSIAGIIWIRLLKTVAEEAYRDILTLGVALMIFGISESAGGNGAISALVFGLVLGNGEEIAATLGMKDVVEASMVMKRFQRQISFLIRTFFFAFLGIIFAVRDPSLIAAGLILSSLFLLGRYLAVRVSTYRAPTFQLDRSLMTIMLGRGLAAAVLANLVAVQGIRIASPLQDITVQVILVTVIISALGIHVPKISHILTSRRIKINANERIE